MLSKIELKLNHSEEIVYQMSSLFHGALMEMLPEEYAEYLHVSQLHPYTQHLEFRNGACCLLYTSPSPRDGLLSRMPSSA